MARTDSEHVDSFENARFRQEERNDILKLFYKNGKREADCFLLLNVKMTTSKIWYVDFIALCRYLLLMCSPNIGIVDTIMGL